MSDYIELHARSAFSFLRGASQPGDLAEAMEESEMPTMALCDRGGVYGSARFHREAKQRGLRAIVGCELPMEDGTVVPVIARTRKGYENMCQLLTHVYLGDEYLGDVEDDGFDDGLSGGPGPSAGLGLNRSSLPDRVGGGHLFGRDGRTKVLPPNKVMRRRQDAAAPGVAWSELSEFAEGLMALSGDEEGPVYRGWSMDGAVGAEVALDKLRRAFGEGNIYLEAQRHRSRGENRWVSALRDLADVSKIPLLATNGVMYAKPGGRRVQDVFTCLREKVNFDTAGGLLSRSAERYVKREAEMKVLFRDMPEAILNTRRAAELVEFSLENLGYEFPRFPVPRGESMDTFLEKVVWEGANRRYRKVNAAVNKQIRRELAFISRYGFSGYFLIVWDLVNYCRDNGIMAQGRGSSANSAVCFCLGITPVDPVGHGLLFERFLSEGRRTWPDIDIDLPSGDLREQVIQEVYRRYGRNGAAMTANVITYRGKSVMREVGKVLGFPEEVLGRFSELSRGARVLDISLEKRFAEAGIREGHPRLKALSVLYNSILGLPRHLGQHSGGMIICEGQLDKVVPLQPASMPGRSVVQWDKEDCEDMGIVKVDLLGLGMMAVMQDSFESIRSRGDAIDLVSIPKDDTKTYEMMQKADTIGVFQIESRAQMATLPRMKPKVFYDVVIQVGIIRPGPIQGKMVHPYLERRAGRQKEEYIDEQLIPTLKRTLGVALFQEQILKVAMVMAAFTGAQADELRRAVGSFGNGKGVEKATDKLRVAMEARGVEKEKIDQVTQSVQSFAHYGFPESHAISFGILAYGSTYLKANYAADFYVALLNNQPMGFYSSATLIQDAKRHGVRVKPVDVTVSGWRCERLDARTIRLGLLMVCGLNRDKGQALAVEREKRDFGSLQDLQDRVRLNRDELRTLASIGALNEFARDRREALWKVESLLDADDLFHASLGTTQDSVAGGGAKVPALPEGYAATREELEDGMMGSGVGLKSNVREELCPLEVMNVFERLQVDYAGTGVTVGKHPMAAVREWLNGLGGVWQMAKLEKARNRQRVEIAGHVICRQRPGTAKGFLFISLEDETGVGNVVVMPKLFERFRLVITQNSYLRVRGLVQNARDVVHLKAERIEALKLGKIPVGRSHDFH